MHIKRMLLLASMALAAVAFTAPAAAQAQTHGLTSSPGVFTPTGTGVTITSTNLITHTALGTLTCGKVTLHYTLTTNSDSHVVLTPVGETTNATTENCTLHTGGGTGATHPVTITSAGTDPVTIDTWGIGTAQSKYTATIFFSGGGSITCTYTGSTGLTVTKGTDVVHIGPSTLSGGLCGHGDITGTGTVETSAGVPLTADIAANT